MARQRRSNVSLEGLDDLLDTLDDLQLKEEILSDASRAGANVVYGSAKSKVPVRTGKLRDSLTLKKWSKSSGKRSAWHVTTNIKYALKVESKKPFMRPATDSNKEQIIRAVSDSIGDAIDRLT